MYVMKSCPYCAHVEQQVAGNPEFEVIDIGSHVAKLKAFLALRDNHPAFAEARAEGDVGVPCYVLPDGRVTLMSADVGLEPLPDDEPATTTDAAADSCAIGGKDHGPDGASCSLGRRGC